MKKLTILFIIQLIAAICYSQKNFDIDISKQPFISVYMQNQDSISNLHLQDGEYRVYQGAEKKLMKKFKIIDGKLHGKYLEWFEDGRISKEIDFNKGKYNGIYRVSLILGGNYLTNIETYKMNVHTKSIQMEW